MSYVIHCRFERGFAWTAQPNGLMERSSEALCAAGRVWLVDPVRSPRIETEIEALGKPAGIIMLAGWHDRDVDWYAARYGVPVYGARFIRWFLVKSPVARVRGEVPGTPFRLLDTSMRGMLSWWTESALWWPEERLLITADVVGRASYFLQPGEDLALHPLVRLSPPDALRGLVPQRIYCGHGPSLACDAPAALHRALETTTADLAPAWLNAVRAFTGRGTRSSAGPSM